MNLGKDRDQHMSLTERALRGESILETVTVLIPQSVVVLNDLKESDKDKEVVVIAASILSAMVAGYRLGLKHGESGEKIEFNAAIQRAIDYNENE